MTLRPEQLSEIGVRADAVRLGDYLLGLGRVQAITSGGRGKSVTLHSEFGLWRVHVDARHRVVVLR